MAVAYMKLFYRLIDINMFLAQLQKEAQYSANISQDSGKKEEDLNNIENALNDVNQLMAIFREKIPL